MSSSPVRRPAERCAPALAAALLLAVFAPLVTTDFGVHNDYRIGGHAGDRSLAFGHVESFHLVRAGRIGNAWLYNRHWNQIDDYTDLRASRALSALVLAASMLGAAWVLARRTALSRAHASFLALALFLTPALTVDAFYAQQLVPGSLTIAASIALFAGQRALLERALEREGAWWALWLNATLTGLVAGHFLYTPSTAMFLVLAAATLLHARDPAPARRAARAEAAVYAASYLVYFLVQTLLVFPWASRRFAFGTLWFDPQYNVALSGVLAKRSFLEQAISLAANAWNAFERVDLAWPVALLLAAGLALAARRSPSAARRHAVFVAGFFAGCFALALAPFLVSTLGGASYRMLVGPLLLVGTGALWSLYTLLGIDARAPLARRSARVLAALAIALAANAATTIAVAVRSARAEIDCFAAFVLRLAPGRTLALVADAAAGNGLRGEFGVMALRDGPLGSFAAEVLRDMARDGELAPGRAQRLERTMRELTEQEARSAVPERVAVLRASACAHEAARAH